MKILMFSSLFLHQVNGDALDNIFKQHSELKFNANKVTGIKSAEGEVEYLEQTLLL